MCMEFAFACASVVAAGGKGCAWIFEKELCGLGLYIADFSCVLGKHHAGLWFACRLVVVFYVARRERSVRHESFGDASAEHKSL